MGNYPKPLNVIMLSAEELVRCRKTPLTTIMFPPKEFEPSGTLEEKLQIENSLGEIEKVIGSQRIKKNSTLSRAIWHPELNLAEVTHQIGSHWNKMGKRINKKLYLQPEEALYMLENGFLDITFNEVSFSIQRAYFVLLASDPQISVEKYRVYSHLKAKGYKVMRHVPKNSNMETSQPMLFTCSNFENPGEKRFCSDSFDSTMKNIKKLKTESESLENLDDNNDREILKMLKRVKCFNDFEESNLSFDFDVYAPSKKTNKSKVNLPDSRIIVHRGCDPMPDLVVIAGLTKKFSDGVPVVNAIAFPDHIAFYQINPINLPDALDL